MPARRASSVAKIGCYCASATMSTISSEQLQNALLQNRHCVLIRGTVKELQDRTDALGIEVTRGDGLHFVREPILFPWFFIYEEYHTLDNNAFLRLGLLGRNYEFAVPMEEESLRRIVQNVGI